MDKQKYKDSIFDEKHDKRTIIHHYSLIPSVNIFEIHDEKKHVLMYIMWVEYGGKGNVWLDIVIVTYKDTFFSSIFNFMQNTHIVVGKS